MADLLIPVDPDSAVPLYQQILTGLEDAIADGHYDERPLPSTRRLAEELGISRNTVLAAYDHLTGQGLIEAVPRKGLYVAPDAIVALRASRRAPRRAAAPVDWAARLAHNREAGEQVDRDPAWRSFPFPFVVGQPDPSLFPVGAWERALREALRPADLPVVIEDAPGADDPLLVQRICDEIAPARGIRATPEQVMVTLGSQHALHLLAALLVRPGTRAYVESPGYVDARAILRIAGADLVPVPVDAEGAVVDGLDGADLLYLTPSHQYPTTVTMSLARREHVLAAAAEAGTVVVEDDYDTEVTFRGTPTVALKALDDDDRVVYLGSFAKTLAPGLRLGYVVAAPELVAAMRERSRYTVRHPPGVLQRALAHLIESRDYARHVRRLRAHYRRRWEAACGAVEQHFTWAPQDLPRGGFAVWVHGLPDLDADRLVRAAAAKGVLLEPGTPYFLGEPRPTRFFRLGYQLVHETRIEEGVRRVAEAVAEVSDWDPGGG